MEKKKYTKCRNWTFIGYPESLIKDWESRMPIIEWACSPIHDKDVTEDGSLKKPHHHVMMRFDGPTTYEHAKEICESIGATIPERVESVKALLRYFYHGDNPDKAQYEKSDIQYFNGFTALEDIDEKQEKQDQLYSEIEEFLLTSNIREYIQLLAYARKHKPDWLEIIRSNPYYLNILVRSKYFYLEESGQERLVDSETGEIVDEERTVDE